MIRVTASSSVAYSLGKAPHLGYYCSRTEISVSKPHRRQSCAPKPFLPCSTTLSAESSLLNASEQLQLSAEALLAFLKDRLFLKTL